MKITISGTPASGKSTIAKALAKKFGFQHYSMGDLQREIAKEKNITIEELGKIEAKDKKIDEMIDKKQKDLGKNNDNFVLDSRLGAHFIPDAIKIFVDADPVVRAKRRYMQKRDEENFDNKEEAFINMQSRQEADRKRFIRYYEFDFLDMSQYDFILDSTNSDVDSCIKELENFLRSLS